MKEIVVILWGLFLTGRKRKFVRFIGYLILALFTFGILLSTISDFIYGGWEWLLWFNKLYEYFNPAVIGSSI